MAEKEPKNVNIKSVKKIIALMKKQEVTELDIEQEGVRIHIKRGSKDVPPQVLTSFPAMVASPQAPAPAPTAAPEGTPAPAVGEEGMIVVDSPMVGTFYISPGPDAPPYVKIGEAVKEGQTLCTIEAMKLMNEVKAESAGTVARILVENGQTVEFGQKLFLIQPAKT